jgi:hypothetical protein
MVLCKSRGRLGLAVPSIALLLLLTFAGVGNASAATTHYISKSTGSDSNNGTAKTSPWAHLPGMPSCSANCASYTPGAGDQFILMGGDTWVASDLGINTCPGNPCWNGTSGSPISVTVDKTWFAGASWTRPIFNCQNTSCTLTGGAIMWMYSDNWILDNIEFTGYQQNGTGTIITIVGAGVEVKNNYIHNFSRTAGSSGSNSFCFSTNFAAGGNGINSSIHDNICDGGDSPNKDFMGGILHGYRVYNNVIRYVYNGMNGVFVDIHGNLVENNYISTSGDHCNMIFPQDTYPGGGNQVFIYNNIVRNKTCGTTIFTLANSSNTSAVAYQYNNVLYNNASGNDGIGSGGHTATGSYFNYNNTVVSNDNCFGNGEAPASKSTTHYGNNHCIAPILCVGTGTTCVNDGGNLQETLAQANAIGYNSTQTYAYAPTAGNSPTVGTGINRTSMCSGNLAAMCSDTSYPTYDTVKHVVVMRTVVPRPASAAWNVGAFQYAQQTQQGTPPSPPTNLTGVIQ